MKKIIQINVQFEGGNSRTVDADEIELEVKPSFRSGGCVGL